MNNKVLYIICYITIILSFTQCAPPITTQYINKKNDQVLEKINVNALLNAKNEKTSEKTVVVDKQFFPDGRLSKLDYYEEDHTNRKNTIISWAPTRIDKKIYTIGSPILQIYNFYQNGVLKSQYDKYVGNVTKGKSLGAFIYSFQYDVVIGKLYLYDQNGNIERVTDYDEKFPFSIGQVLNLMKEKYDANIQYMKINQRGLGVRNFDVEQPYWEVVYTSSKKLGEWLIHIDGKTGEVTEKGVFIVHES